MKNITPYKITENNLQAELMGYIEIEEINYFSNYSNFNQHVRYLISTHAIMKHKNLK